MMQRSRPWLSYPMLYGCGCGIVGNFNRLTTSTDIRLFWLPLLTMKCNGTPFTHIYEWKRRSPSSSSFGSSGWIWVVATVALGFASMTYFPLSISESEWEYGSNSEAFSLATSDYFVRHSLVLCQGLLWKSHHFLVSFFVFPFPLLVCDLDGLSRGWLYLLGPLVYILGFPLDAFWCDAFTDPKYFLFLCLNFCSILIA